MGRWDPKLRGAAHTPDETPDADDDPPAVHYRERITALEAEKTSAACTGDRLDQVDRELQQWRQLLEAEERDEHWQAGAGDRTLF